MRPDFANKLDFLWLSLIEMWVGVERGFLFLNEKLECFLVGSVWGGYQILNSSGYNSPY